MFDAIADWPMGAKIMAGCTAAMVAVLAWSIAASAVLLWWIHQWHGGFPLQEWWTYHAWYPLPPPATAAQNAALLRGLRASAMISTAIPLALLLATLARHYAPQIAHDNARFANWWDLRRNGFSTRTGLYLGRVRGRWLRLGSGKRRKNIAVYAPSQSGKGVGFVIPAGLCDQKERASFLFFDPKFEAFLKTSGWQQEIGAHVVLFAPLSETGQTAQYNPCAYVRRNADGSPTVDTWGDIEDIVHTQIPMVEGPQGFWNRTARSAYTAVLAFLSETDNARFHIPEAIRLLTKAGGPEYIRTQIDQRRAAGKPYSEPCVRNLAEFITGNADLHDGINRTITSYLGIFSNPRVVAATSGNTFDLRQVLKQRMAIYVGVNPPDIEKLQPLLQLFFQQLVDLNMRTPPGTDPDVQFELDAVLDEFAQLGAMHKLANAFAYCAGYGIRLLPVIQTPSQLVDIYKDAGARKILDNCKIEIVLGPEDIDLCTKISRRLGTVKGARHGLSGNLLGGWMKANRSSSAMERALMSPYEVSQMPEDRALVLHGSMPGVVVKRIRYFDQAPFRRRLLDPVPIPAIPVDLRFDDGTFLPPPAPPPPKGKGKGKGKGAGGAAAPAPALVVVTAPAAAPAPAPQAAPPAAKPKGKKTAAAAPPASGRFGLTVPEAEQVLAAATGGAVDLDAFAQSPDAARAQIDRVLAHIPTKGRSQ